jgi:hypothetical protein
MSGSPIFRCAAGICAFAISASAGAALQFDQNVTNNVIYGGGNDNGAWTVERNSGVEVGLRAHVRFDVVDDLPKNVFGSNGDGTYNHAAGAPAAFPNLGRWNFDFSINSNYDGNGLPLGRLTYQLDIDSDPSAGTIFDSFDPLNVSIPPSPVPDHSFGDNGTPQGGGTEAADATDYASLLASSNLAQNSWNMGFFPTLFSFDPNANGIYTFVLSASDATGLLARTSIDVIVGTGATVPVPATLALLVPGLLALGWQVRSRGVRYA